MVKELRTVQDDVQCEICGRTILKGERPETFLAPGGTRRLVCELCWPRAEHEGWIRESAAGDVPVTTRHREPRRSLLGRLRRRREEDELVPLEEEEYDEAWVTGETELPEGEPAPAPAQPEPEPAPRRRRKDARHVRAVPTNAEVKVERALARRALGQRHSRLGGAERGEHRRRLGALLVPLPRGPGRRRRARRPRGKGSRTRRDRA